MFFNHSLREQEFINSIIFVVLIKINLSNCHIQIVKIHLLFANHE